MNDVDCFVRLVSESRPSKARFAYPTIILEKFYGLCLYLASVSMARWIVESFPG